MNIYPLCTPLPGIAAVLAGAAKVALGVHAADHVAVLVLPAAALLLGDLVAGLELGPRGQFAGASVGDE